MALLAEAGLPPPPALGVTGAAEAEILAPLGELALERDAAAARLLAEIEAARRPLGPVPDPVGRARALARRVGRAETDRARAALAEARAAAAEAEAAESRAAAERTEALSGQAEARARAELAEARAALDRRTAELEAEIARLYRSHSYRVTAPLRAIRRLVTLGRSASR